MLKLDRMVMLSVVGLMSLASLVGCSNQPQATTEQATTEQATTEQPASTTTTTAPVTAADAGMAPGFDGLNQVITNTQMAAETGDFAKAKTEFEQFETYWSQVEDGIKAKSADTYDAIEKNMDEIDSELKASTPDKDKVLAALQSIQTNVTSVAK